jgi:hypothetical protein
MYFAEFLNHRSPDRLGILYLPTCVGLGYGQSANSLDGFLGSMGSVTSPNTVRHHVSGSWGPDLPRPRPTRLPQVNQRLGSPTLLRHAFAALLIVGRFVRRQPLSNNDLGWTRTDWYWNINQLCIDYASRPRLSSRLTLGGLAFPRNPWASGGGVSHPSLATHASIRTRPRSTPGFHRRFTARSTLPYHASTRDASATSARCLSPVTLSAQDHSTSELLRTLSRVAASKPTSWLSVQSHIVSHLASN